VVLEALIASKKFKVTVGTRDASNHSFPEGVEVVQIDYSSQESLVSAFKGQDAVVVTIGNHNPALLEQIQMEVVNAAVAAGVTHIIPSNFGGDLALHRNPVLEFKIRVEEHLDKLSSEGKINYTAIGTGIFFNWGLMNGFLGFDLVNKKATLLNDGNLKLNFTNLSTIAEAITTILSNPGLIKNRLALIHDVFVSQNDILKVAEEELEAKFEVSYVNTEDLRRKSEAGLPTGDPAAVVGLIQATVWGPDSPCAWGVDDDSKVLGHATKDLRKEVVNVINEMKLRV